MSKVKEISIQKANTGFVMLLFIFGVLLSAVALGLFIEYLVQVPSTEMLPFVDKYTEQVRLLGRDKSMLTVMPYKLDLYSSVVQVESYIITIPVVILSFTMVIIMGITRKVMINDLVDRIGQSRRVVLQERKRKKEALMQLEKSEEHLNQMHEQLTEAFMVINKDERFHHLNRVGVQFLAKWNKTPKSLRHYMQQPVEAFVADYHSSGLALCVQDAVSKKLSWQKELRFESINKWMQVRVYPTGGDTAYVYMRDITADKTPEHLRMMGDVMLGALSETSPFAIAVMDRQWNYLVVTKEWKEAFCLGDGKLEGQNHKAMLPRLPGKWPAVEAQLVDGKSVRSEGMQFNLNGKDELVQWELSPWGAGDKVQGFMMYASIITDQLHNKEKLEQQREREHKLAYHDILTGLPNRQLFYDRLTMALAHAYRNLGKVALFFLDLDGFKGINDNLGHDIGDMLLKEVATRLKKCVRDTDTVARLGGDEFTVILNGIHSEEDAMHVAQKIIKSINEVFKLGDHDVYVSTSIGISLYPLDGSTSSELMKKADTAMYWSKEGGKNQSNFFTKELNTHNADGGVPEVAEKVEGVTSRELESQIRTALQKNEMEVFLQPTVDLAKKQAVSVEALVRWKHPQAGMLEPRQFLNIAENTGMILPIGEFVLTELAQKAKQWKSLSASGAGLKFSMNLSPRQLKDESLVERITRICKGVGVSPQSIIFEVSESQIADADEKMMERLKQISKLGFAFYVDDIGESYASLQNLKDIQLAGFKVQPALLKNAVNSNEDKSKLMALQKLAANMNIPLMAKGVEEEDVLTFIQNMRINMVQGYVVAQPNKPEQIEKLLEGI